MIYTTEGKSLPEYKRKAISCITSKYKGKLPHA